VIAHKAESKEIAQSPNLRNSQYGTRIVSLSPFFPNKPNSSNIPITGTKFHFGTTSTIGHFFAGYQ
jgi:hypothetical protein